MPIYPSLAPIAPTQHGAIYFEAEGARGITSVLPPLTENNPAPRLLIHHPGSNSTPAADFIITPYEYGMGLSYDGSGTVQFSSAQVAINGPSSNTAPGNLVVSDQLDLGSIWLTSHVGGTSWAGETYGEIRTQRWDETAHGSIRLRVINTPRTITDGTTNSANTITSATAAFVSTDVGRRITGAGIPAQTSIVTVTNSTTALINANATATASGITMTIGTEAIEAWTGTVAAGVKQVSLGALGPAGEAGMVFGAADDTNLYRSAAATLKTDGALSVVGNVTTQARLVGPSAGALQIIAPSAGGIGFLNAAGSIYTFFVDNAGQAKANGGMGFWNHAAPASQPAAPTLLADVIAIIRGCGLSA